MLVLQHVVSLGNASTSVEDDDSLPVDAWFTWLEELDVEFLDVDEAISLEPVECFAFLDISKQRFPTSVLKSDIRVLMESALILRIRHAASNAPFLQPLLME